MASPGPAEESLRRSDERHRRLADAMPHLVWTAGPDGAVDYYNRRRCLYDGIDQAEDGRWRWQPFVHAEDLERTLAAWRAAVAATTPYACEHRLRMRDGSFRWHLSRAEPELDADGAVLRWFGSATDIHDQKRAEEDLRQANRDLEQFVYVAAHDLQEPLRTISLTADLAERHLDRGPEALAGHLRRIRDSALRMRQLMADLLAYTRVVGADEGGGSQRADLQAVLAEVLGMLGERLGETGARVECAPLPTVRGDPAQLAVVLMNLLANALKYQAPGSTPEVRIEAKCDGRLWTIAVSDNGIGFDPVHAERIFGLFKRLHGSSFAGTGLGLAICRRIVERCGGRIWAASAGEGRGGSTFTFTFTLPSAEDGHA